MKNEDPEQTKAKKIKIFDGTQWVDKGGANGAGISSFFPSSWNKQKILEETALAYKKAKVNPSSFYDTTSINAYDVQSSDGILKIRLFIGQPNIVPPNPLSTNNTYRLVSSFPKN